MHDFPDAEGYYFYVQERSLWNKLCERISCDYTLTLIDKDDDYYIYEVSEN